MCASRLNKTQGIGSPGPVGFALCRAVVVDRLQRLLRFVPAEYEHRSSLFQRFTMGEYVVKIEIGTHLLIGNFHSTDHFYP